MDGAEGVTAIDTSPGPVTVSEAVPVIVPEAAVMVTGPPAVTPVAKPAVVIVAIPVVEELQITLPVRFCVELSVYVPVAVYCWVVPFAMVAETGVTAIDCNVGLVTVREAVPAIEPEVAVIVTGPPTATPVAKPAVEIGAGAVAEEIQITLPVRFWVELSV